MRIIFAALLCVFYLINVCFSEEAVVSETWNWLPQWRDQADCGPNALYVLMNLEGHNVKLEEVKKLVPLDPIAGCSMGALISAADKLGFPLEARFVKPNDVHKLPRPFILHGITSHEKNLGHFIVVADFDSKERNFALIDPIRETYGWNPEESLLYDFSGYVLVPKYPMAWRWNLTAGIVLIFCGIACFMLLYRYRLKNITPHKLGMFITIALLSLMSAGCNQSSSDDIPARRAARGETIPLSIKAREFPLQVKPVSGLEHCATDEQIPILEPAMRTKAETWVKQVVSVLEKTQKSDGTWPRDWGATGQEGFLYGDAILDNITIIGHHLEWLGLVPKELRVSDSVIEKGVAAVIAQIEQQPPLEYRSFKTILPCSHVGVALCQFQQKQAADFVIPLFSEKEE